MASIIAHQALEGAIWPLYQIQSAATPITRIMVSVWWTSRPLVRQIWSYRQALFKSPAFRPPLTVAPIHFSNHIQWKWLHWAPVGPCLLHKSNPTHALSMWLIKRLLVRIWWASSLRSQPMWSMCLPPEMAMTDLTIKILDYSGFFQRIQPSIRQEIATKSVISIGTACKYSSATLHRSLMVPLVAMLVLSNTITGMVQVQAQLLKGILHQLMKC